MSFVPVAVGELVEQHAAEAAFIWSQRDQGARSPGYDLDDLADLDEQLAAHLDGLRLAGDVGWRLALEALDEEAEAGEAFVAAKVALDRQDMRAFALVVDRVGDEESLWRALPAAVGFCAFERVDKALRAMVAPKVPALLKRMGIAGFTVHRHDPGMALGEALSDEDATVRWRALKAIGEIGATRLQDQLGPAMGSDDVQARFWAARSAALLGLSSGLPELQRAAEQGDGALAERAVRLAASLLEPQAARAWIASLDGAGRRRIALVGAETAGDPQLLGWIAACMREQEHARRAGYAFYAITGTLIDDELEGEEPEELDEEPLEDLDEDDEAEGDDPDADLPWPEPDAVDAWLKGNVEQLPAGRLLLGQPIQSGWLETVLRDGPQPLRQLAAWLRFRDKVDAVPFQVRAPAWEQRAKLPARPLDFEPLT